ncbi:MAG: hypothetical protein ABI629_17050 [bacterium]
MHFDLSHNGAISDARLIVFNSTSYLARLQAHDAASRQRFRQATPGLESVPDVSLTRYLEDVDLPADALQMVQVLATSGGETILVGAYINIPTTTLADYAERAVRGKAPLPLALMARYGTDDDAAAIGAMLAVNTSLVTPLSTAVAVCFHHPDVMNLHRTLGANTLVGYIQNLPVECTNPDQGCKFIDGLALWIATNSPATTTPGVGDAGGADLRRRQTRSRQGGNQVYRYDLTDATLMEMAQPLHETLSAVFNDPQYEGSNWNATTGLTTIEQSQGGATGGDTSFELQASLPVGSTHNGIEFISLAVTDATTRSVQLGLKNRYLRWLRAYAQYFAPDGTPLPVESPTDDDARRAKYIREITSNNQIMGIPLMGNDVGTTTLDFQIPEAASKVRIIIGGLGMGGEAFSPEALVGSALTLAFNIGVPTLLLSWGIGESASAGLSELAGNAALRKSIVSALRLFLVGTGESYAVGIYGSATSLGRDLLHLGSGEQHHPGPSLELADLLAVP